MSRDLVLLFRLNFDFPLAPQPKPTSAEASAATCKRFAASSIHETHLSGPGARGLKRAASSHCIRNAERDLHNVFRDEGLALPILPKVADGLDDVPYLSLHTWFPFLLKSYSCLLLGGFQRQHWNAKLLLTTFWENFQGCFPTHEFFNIREPDEYARSVPFYLHIDEGTGLKKNAVLILSFQCIFGRESADRFAEYQGIPDQKERMTRAQWHNSRGSTFLTRFLVSALPKKVYGGKLKDVYYQFLDVVAKECRDLFTEGIVIENEIWYPICLGVKGDQPALIKSGKMKRSFMNLGKDKGCCWECLAGNVGLPFEQVSTKPSWECTIGVSDPWLPEDKPSLLQIPGYGINAHSFWRRDPFHAFKQTLGGHFTASLIILFTVDFGLWKADGLSKDVGEMLDRAFLDFRYWVRHEWRGKVVNHVVAFTRALLHFSDNNSFPFWRIKGSDIMLILRWLHHVILHGVYLEGQVTRSEVCFINNPPEPWQAEWFDVALKGCVASTRFFHTMHCEGVWLDQATAKNMASDCFKLCASFQKLAVLCHEKRMARFHLEPCLHNMMHFFVELDRVEGTCLSPALANCEMCEDFIGKIARISRHVHAKSCTRRVIDRYLIRCQLEFEKV
eukprot:Skav220649  [mRNA]  locus=scaffold2038:214513:216366:+ [translate_table: standard]